MLDTSNDRMRQTSGGRNATPIMEIMGLHLWYGETQALNGVDFELFDHEILAFVGPDGGGKTTTLKALNRMHDGSRHVRIAGTIRMDGIDIDDPAVDPPMHRRRFGWVAQKPNPFPISVYENVAYGARVHCLAGNTADMDALVERCLRRAHLWDEVKDQLYSLDGTALPLGQQQRLCVARALSTNPDVILMDEPTRSCDPRATQRFEELMMDLRQDHAVVVVTQSMRQARRVADRIACFDCGEILDIGSKDAILDRPSDARVREIIAACTG